MNRTSVKLQLTAVIPSHRRRPSLNRHCLVKPATAESPWLVPIIPSWFSFVTTPYPAASPSPLALAASLSGKEHSIASSPLPLAASLPPSYSSELITLSADFSLSKPPSTSRQPRTSPRRAAQVRTTQFLLRAERRRRSHGEGRRRAGNARNK